MNAPASISVACLQLCSAADTAANGRQIAEFSRAAAAQGAQLIALPENAYLMEQPGQERTLYAEADHPGVLHAVALARELGVWLLVGSIAIRTDDSGKTVNRGLLITPDGDIAARYDKIHLFDVELSSGEIYAESSRFLPGAQAVLADMGGISLGLTICYDVRFPQLYRTLAQAGAQILAVPAAFTATTGEAHWHTLLRARAIENGCFVVAPAQTGTHPGGRKTFGHALIIDPWGRVLADAGTEPGFALATLELPLAQTVRSRLPSLSHDRPYTLTAYGKS